MKEARVRLREQLVQTEILRQAEAQLTSGHAMGQAEPVGVYEELDHTGPGVGGNKTQERFLEEVS